MAPVLICRGIFEHLMFRELRLLRNLMIAGAFGLGLACDGNLEAETGSRILGSCGGYHRLRPGDCNELSSILF
jgi:hypothetical protein